MPCGSQQINFSVHKYLWWKHFSQFNNSNLILFRNKTCFIQRIRKYVLKNLKTQEVHMWNTWDLCNIPALMAHTHVCFGSSVHGNTNTTSPVGIRKCNNSARVIKLRWHSSKITLSDTLSPFPDKSGIWGSSPTLVFDITVTYHWSLNMRMYISWCPNQRYVWIEKLQRGGERQKEKKGGQEKKSGLDAIF